jgi:N-acyl-D-aspartate/D-glutamate deacylase
MHLVLRGAQLADGGRRPVRLADVEVDGGRIVRVGDVPRLPDATDVDLSGLILAPGFIDAHTHFDAQVFWDPDFTPSSWHGVTTVVMGNCGFGLAPSRPADRDLMMQTLEHVEGMNLGALRAGIDWTFETFPEFLDALRSRPLRLNVAAMLGHTPLRFYVMGREAEEREATDDEIDRMCALVADAMAAGAAGFSSSQAPSHIGPTGNPVPSRIASRDEIRRLLVAMAGTGRGIAEITYGPQYQIEEVAQISKELGVRITWGSLVTSLFGGHGACLELLERASAVGGDIWPQVSCRLIINVNSFEDPNHFVLVPAFRDIFSVGREERLKVYADPDWRARAKAEFPQHRPMWWDQAWVTETTRFPELKDRSIAEIAAERNADPWDLMLDLALAEDLKTRFSIVSRNGDTEELTALLTDPRTVLGAHDAGAHVDMLCDAVFPTYLLGHWVREQQAMSVEDAVWRLSGQVADVFRIPGRGFVREGYAADLVAFDPDTVGALPAERVWDFPADADRLIAHSTGLEHVWVNGQPVRQHGKDIDGAATGTLV